MCDRSACTRALLGQLYHTQTKHTHTHIYVFIARAAVSVRHCIIQSTDNVSSFVETLMHHMEEHHIITVDAVLESILRSRRGSTARIALHIVSTTMCNAWATLPTLSHPPPLLPLPKYYIDMFREAMHTHDASFPKNVYEKNCGIVHTSRHLRWGAWVDIGGWGSQP